MKPIITSVLDTDLYKITMGQAVFHHYDSLYAKYTFINRGGTLFPRNFGQILAEQVAAFSDLYMTEDEIEFLRSKCYYMSGGFLDWLKTFRFDPSEVFIYQNGGDLQVSVQGPWYRTIYWEVPLLATISELYFQTMGIEPEKMYLPNALEKGHNFRKAGIRFAEFGTRRRFSSQVHRSVLNALVLSAGKTDDGGVLNGTSNVMLAKEYGLTPIGTFAHEWVMAHQAIFGNRMATQMALQTWADEFDAYLGIALTDTFTTEVFWESFGPRFAKLFDGVRQDSGDPFSFTDHFIAHLKKLRINPLHKSIVFSDALNFDRARKLNLYCQDKVMCSFGIGTNLTNDVGTAPLNMVIKLSEIKLEKSGRWIPVVKLSDNPGKETGDPRAIDLARFELGIP